jgi:predicted AlkP superfamily phosphohydrolase/phosphomutase
VWRLVVGLVLFLALLAFFTHQPCRRATRWGTLWGLALGFWLLAPLALEVNHLRPTTLRAWTIVAVFFLLTFVTIGGVLALAATTPFAASTWWRKRNVTSSVWLEAIWPALWMPILYVGLGLLIEWANFGQLPPVSRYQPLVRPTMTLYAALILLAFVVWALRNAPRRSFVLGRALVVAAVAGLIALPFRLTPIPASQQIELGQLVRRADARRTPLLVVGLDGGNWRTLRPLMQRGAVPMFSRLAASGIEGNIEALWPPYWSTPAWGAIVTGHPQDAIGVHEDLSAVAPGLPPFELPLTLDLALDPIFAVEYGLIGAHVIEPMPTPREALKRPPVWERLSRAGTKTAVVRFPFTYPALGQADYVVSNRVITDVWDIMGVRPGRQDLLVEPTSYLAPVLARFATDSDSEDPDASWLLPGPRWEKPRDAVIDPTDVLTRSASIQRKMNDTAMELVRGDPALSVVMLHVAGFDNVCHAFWQYRFPEDFPANPPSAKDVEHLGTVIDRYLELIDRQLRGLIEAFPSPPNVLIVADHGEGPDETSALWRGWHTSPGLFLAAGPDIPHGEKMLNVSYYDIVPTILDLQGFQKADDLQGKSLVDTRRPEQ